MIIVMSYKLRLLASIFLFTLIPFIHPESIQTVFPPLSQKVEFTEIWAYVYEGDMANYNPERSISDIGVFGSGLSIYGNLYGVPKRKAFSAFQGRVHLVVAEVSNSALTHFCINPDLPMRNKLIQDILVASQDFDGLQIDFELVQPKDKENFFSFLKALKEGLGDKPLSVAVPARTRKLTSDAYDYTLLNTIVDRVIVMAYDEHWSGSKPGPIASLEWGKRVSWWALSCFGPEKLVMGLPFYGRAWADINPAKAYKHPSIQNLIQEKAVTTINRENEIPYFTYEQPVQVTVYFDDSHSTFYRARMYQGAKVKNIAFWKIGQEDPDVWNRLSLEPNSRP